MERGGECGGVVEAVALSCMRALHRTRTALAKVVACTQIETSFLTFSCARGRWCQRRLDKTGRAVRKKETSQINEIQ